MYNKEALQLSNSTKENMFTYIKESLPYIKDIHEINPQTNLIADYLHQVDAVGISDHGGNYNIQLKSRQEKNKDVRLEAFILTGPDIYDSSFGFKIGSHKFSFDAKADIYCQLVDGKYIIYSAEELRAIENFYTDLTNFAVSRQAENYTRDGKKFPVNGYFHIFIPPETFKYMIFNAFVHRNRILFPEYCKEDDYVQH